MPCFSALVLTLLVCISLFPVIKHFHQFCRPEKASPTASGPSSLGWGPLGSCRAITLGPSLSIIQKFIHLSLLYWIPFLSYHVFLFLALCPSLGRATSLKVFQEKGMDNNFWRLCMPENPTLTIHNNLPQENLFHHL